MSELWLWVKDWTCYYLIRFAMFVISIACSLSKEGAAMFGESVRVVDWKAKTRPSRPPERKP